MTGRQLRTLHDVEPLLRRPLVVAVLGCHPEAHRPAHYVPAWLHRHGHTVLPVNSRFVGQQQFDGVSVGVVSDLNVAVDVVDVFRRGPDVSAHVDEILAMQPLPKVVWLQSGIENAEATARLREAGIDTVEDRCMLADGEALGL